MDSGCKISAFRIEYKVKPKLHKTYRKCEEFGSQGRPGPGEG